MTGAVSPGVGALSVWQAPKCICRGSRRSTACSKAPNAIALSTRSKRWRRLGTSRSHPRPRASLPPARQWGRHRASVSSRELAALLRELSLTEPLIVFFEDLHWADISTVDLLPVIADRLDGIHSLFVVTYRPSDLLLAKHPFVQVKQGLQARGTCRELPLQ